MPEIDVEKLLEPVSADRPCGEDLEYQPAFVEMERAARGKEEQQMGDTVVPAEAPNWRDVAARAVELLSLSKDLRVAVVLTRALVCTDGLRGLADGLSVVGGLLDRYWDDVHPRLDPDDDYDPTLRLNTVAGLADPEAVLRAVREAPLVESGTAGRFSLRDVQLATGALPPPPDTQVPDLPAVEAAFASCEVRALQATAQAVEDAIARVNDIEAALADRIGAVQSANLSELEKVLGSCRQVLRDHLARRGAGQGETSDVEAAAPGEAPRSGSAGLRAAAAPGEIASRDDVVRALDHLCEYFERHEPSSPVPILLRRARRLVSKSFLDIIRDLAPDGLAQVEALRGVDTLPE
jgi:type VI secretion system protein ImpA